MSVRIVVVLQANDETRGSLVDLLGRLSSGTRRADGFEHLEICTDANDMGRVVLIERWRDTAAYSAYTEWRRTQGDLARISALICRQPRVDILHSELTTRSVTASGEGISTQ